MNHDSVTLNECSNDGSKAYLYYIDDTGQWCTFGVSAYIIDRVLKPSCNGVTRSFSRKMQMPAVTIDNTMFEHICSQYTSQSIDGGKMLLLDSKYDLNDYAKWTTELRNRQFDIY